MITGEAGQFEASQPKNLEAAHLSAEEVREQFDAIVWGVGGLASEMAGDASAHEQPLSGGLDAVDSQIGSIGCPAPAPVPVCPRTPYNVA